MYSLKEIKENYRSFSDSKIENIARNESKGLRKEGLHILKDEITRRNLNPNLINWINTEAKSYEGLERKTLLKDIQSQNCPRCNYETKLYGFETNTVKSFLIAASIKRKEFILCMDCGKKEKLNAIVITFFAGWWSGSGFLKTPYYILTDIFNFLYIDKISARILEKFIDKYNGTFRRHGANSSTITRLINLKNKNAQ